MLHFVQHKQRAGDAPVTSLEQQGLLDGREELLGGDVPRKGRITCPQGLSCLGFARSEASIAGEQCLGDRAADVQIVQLAVESLARGLHGFADFVEVPLRMKPEAEAGLRVLFRQARCAKHDAQDRESNLVGRAARQRARGRDQPAGATTSRVELAEQFAQFIRQRGHQRPCTGSIGECGVLPEVAQHLQQVRLAAAEEPADPHRLLVGLSKAVQKRANDLLDAVGVLTLANESGKFASQFLERSLVLDVDDARLPLVHQWVGRRVALQDLVDLHSDAPSPCKVMGTAK